MKGHKLIEELKKRQNALRYLYSPAKDEIHTPLGLVKEMLDKMPGEVWKNPNLKWLDPACKTGVFLSEVIIRLFEGLRNWEPNDKKRYNHIINNMIYGYAFSEIGALTTRKTLYGDSHSEEGNIKIGLFVKEDIKMKFDIIVGNPPWQEVSNSVWGSNQTADKIWMKFIEVSFLFLSNNGYIAFVTPNNWLYNTSKINTSIKDKNLIYANIDSNYLKKTYFSNIGHTVSYFIIQNSNKKDIPIIRFEKGIEQKYNIFDLKLIPRRNSYSIIDFSILDKLSNKKRQNFWIRNVNKKCYPENNGLTIGIDIVTCEVKNIKDINGQMYWHECKTILEYKSIFSIFNSKVFQYCLNNIKSGQFIVHTINDLLIPTFNKEWSDTELYEYFNLTAEEIRLIEESVK